MDLSGTPPFVRMTPTRQPCDTLVKADGELPNPQICRRQSGSAVLPVFMSPQTAEPPRSAGKLPRFRGPSQTEFSLEQHDPIQPQAYPLAFPIGQRERFPFK